MDKTQQLIDWEANEKTDRNRNGLADEIEPPIPDASASAANLNRRLQNDPNADPIITAGELDARWEAAQFSGDETAVTSMSTPDQNGVEEIGRAMGITYEESEELKVGEKERERDKHRWELDPASSDDYLDRIKEEKR